MSELALLLGRLFPAEASSLGENVADLDSVSRIYMRSSQSSRPDVDSIDSGGDFRPDFCSGGSDSTACGSIVQASINSSIHSSRNRMGDFLDTCMNLITGPRVLRPCARARDRSTMFRKPLTV